jgi:uncharacterized protein YaaW (UPF0174 family)
MLTEKLEQIAQLKSKLASLEKDLLQSLRSISSSEALVGALGGAKKSLKRRTRRKARPKAAKKAAKKVVRKAASKATKQVAKKAVRKVAKKTARKSGGRRKRTTITPQLRNDIIAAIKGGATGAAVAKKFGVSVPTVQNIKKAAGLIRKS